MVGRFAQAIRDIKCGEIILRERPLLVGPKIISTPICLGCNRSLSPQDIIVPGKNRKSKPQIVRNYFKCSKCKWPLCGEACEKSTAHTAECALMAEKKFQCSIEYNADDENKKESAYCAILPLRCLLLSKIDPKGYALEKRMSFIRVNSLCTTNFPFPTPFTCRQLSEIHAAAGSLDRPHADASVCRAQVQFVDIFQDDSFHGRIR